MAHDCYVVALSVSDFSSITSYQLHHRGFYTACTGKVSAQSTTSIAVEMESHSEHA